MNHASKRLRNAVISLLTALVLIFGTQSPLLGVLRVSAEEGVCGTSTTWTLSNGVLTISGTGAVTSNTWSAYSKQITSVVISNGVTALPANVFYGYTALKTITIADSVTELSRSLCYNCTALTSVKLPSTITAIPASAFYGCRALTEISIPSGVTSIGKSAFSNCIGLTSVTIPDAVTTIADSAFYATNLTSVKLGASVTSIGADAFNFTCLTSVTIPDSVSTIGADAFGYCYKSIYYEDGKCYGSGSTGVKVTIIGAAGGAAETYAKAYSHPFTATGSVPEHTHTWSAWTTETAAGCETDGTNVRTCANCGEKEYQTVPATGHSWSAWKSETPAGCETDGKNVRTCTNCGEKEYQTVPATGHSWGDWKVIYDATTEREGLMQRTCANCGETESKTIPKLDPHVHTWSAWTAEIAAGCETEGRQVRTCASCGEKEYQTVPATGHSWSEWTAETAPGCETEGRQVRTCANCGEKEYQSIPATSHSWSDWETVLAPTLEREGLMQRTCANCGEKQQQSIPKKTGYQITITTGEGGSVSPSGSFLVEEGGSFTVTVTPDDGYRIGAVIIDSTQQSQNSTLTFTDVRSNHTISVTFVKQQNQTRTCVGIIANAIQPMQEVTKESFDMRDFQIIAVISENDRLTRVNITDQCSPGYFPSMYQSASMLGSAELLFRYNGTDSEIAAFVKSQPISVGVQMYLRGDGNRNCTVDTDDAIAALRAGTLASIGAEDELDADQRAALDVNLSDSVDVSDAIYILRYFNYAQIGFNENWEDLIGS